MSDPNSPDSAPASETWRLGWGLLLLVCLGWVGMVAGTALGAAWTASSGGGLAAAAQAMVHGLLGLTLGVVAAGYASFQLARPALRRAAVSGLVLALVAAGIVWARSMEMRLESRGALAPTLAPRTPTRTVAH